MWFAQADKEALATLGVPGLIAVIFVLAGVIIFLYKKVDKIQEQRILDAKEFGNKIAEPLESIRGMNERQSALSEKMYEILRDSKRGN